jgi:hypothetical protein
LGRRKNSFGSRWCSKLSSFEASRSTRRTATVTISAPEARNAATVCSASLYLPVPTISRDTKVRPPIARGFGSAANPFLMTVLMWTRYSCV